MHANLNIIELNGLSPFELKDRLIEAARGSSNAAEPGQMPMRNAGRGNPNFFATVARHGFFQLGLFAMQESALSPMDAPEHVGSFSERERIEERFELFCSQNSNVNGVEFLHYAVSFVRDRLGLNVSQFLYEMCQGILACNYPVPDRMLKLSEEIVRRYIHMEMIGEHVSHVFE